MPVDAQPQHVPLLGPALSLYAYLLSLISIHKPFLHHNMHTLRKCTSNSLISQNTHLQRGQLQLAPGGEELLHR